MILSNFSLPIKNPVPPDRYTSKMRHNATKPVCGQIPRKRYIDRFKRLARLKLSEPACKASWEYPKNSIIVWTNCFAVVWRGMAFEGTFKQNGHNVVVGDAGYFTSYAGLFHFLWCNYKTDKDGKDTKELFCFLLFFFFVFFCLFFSHLMITWYDARSLCWATKSGRPCGVMYVSSSWTPWGELLASRGARGQPVGETFGISLLHHRITWYDDSGCSAFTLTSVLVFWGLFILFYHFLRGRWFMLQTIDLKKFTA